MEAFVASFVHLFRYIQEETGEILSNINLLKPTGHVMYQQV